MTSSAFDAAKVTITRKRFSVTQGEVLIEYAGQRIEQYGDKIELRDGEWTGYSDAFWMGVAKREAIARGLATDPTPPILPARSAVRSKCRCDGLKARVDREVQLAAISDAPDRLARLRFWHARQRTAEAIYHRHGLCWARSSNNEPPRFRSLPRYSCPSEAALNCER